jgi:hypothetical protein
VKHLLLLVIAWNGAALVFGLIGLFRRHLRPALARLTGALATAAVGSSVAALVGGLVCTFLAPSIAGGATFFAFSFWALGGIFPLTVTMFLRAQPRGEGSD